MPYNEEEVKELFEVVFKLSAKDINDKLIKVRNRPDIAKRRWFWELLQNAKDAVKPDEKVSVKLIIDTENGHPFVDFQHNGNPFRYQDAKNLIFPYSDKGDEEKSDKSGRFGTGFLATHVLSKKIEVTGVYLKDTSAFNFNFTLDRSGNDKPEIATSIDTTWQEFREKRTLISDYYYDPNRYETSFRYLLANDMVPFVEESIQDVYQSLPYVLAFIPKIQKIEIRNCISGNSTEYHKLRDTTEHLNEHLKKVSIEKKFTEGEKSVSSINHLIIGSDNSIDMAIQVI